MITDQSIQLVKDTARVEDVVGDYVNLRRRGQNLLGLCPFHNEKTPSFNVNPARNIYKCFGCGEAGDPIKFVMSLEQLSFPDAIRKIAARYNIKLEEKEVSQEVREERQVKEALILVNEFAQKYYADQLYNTDEGKSIGLSYFKSRGFRREVMDKFGLGYAPAGRNGLLKAAVAAGYKAELLEQLGLVRNGKDFFWDRVMFTIHNLQGKPIAFAGRILKKDVKAPKYVNSPESEVYYKSEVLYGLHQARGSVRKLDNIYMVEGYTDVISLHQNGVENVVATSGTSLTPGQARLVKRQTSNVTLLYDGDKAGIKAALRGVDVLLEADLNVRVVILPEGEDPDSYMQKVGTTAFTEYLEKTKQDFLFFKADLLLNEAGDDVAARSAAIRSSIATLALVDDPLKRANYLQKFTIKLGLEESLLINLVNQAVADRREKVRKEQEREARRKDAQARRTGNTQGQRPPRRNQLPPVRPATNFPDEAPPPVDFGPPPPVEAGDWPSEEPGGSSSSTAEYSPDWGGEEGYQEPSFDGFDADVPPPISEVLPERPADELSNEQDILWTGHTFQERGVSTLLIQLGHKLYDEEASTSVAAYFTANIADVLEDFDSELYKKIVTAVMDYVRQHNAGPTTEWFLNHPEEGIKKEAASVVVSPYQLSPNWKEKYGVRLSQKMPENNQKVAVDTLLNNFRLLKVERKIEFVQKEITKAQQAGDDKMLKKYFRLLATKLLPIRNELAKQNQSVVIKK